MLNQLKRTNAKILCVMSGIGATVFAAVVFAGATPNLDLEVGADFGDVEYSVGTGYIEMGSNASIVYSGPFSGSPLGVAGQFRIRITGVGAAGAVYTIACDDSSAAVSDGGGNTLPIQMDFVVDAGSRTSYGGGNACQGLGVVVGGLTGTTRTIYTGTRIDIGSSIPSGGIYSTSNAGGSPVIFEVIIP